MNWEDNRAEEVTLAVIKRMERNEHSLKRDTKGAKTSAALRKDYHTFLSFLANFVTLSSLKNRNEDALVEPQSQMSRSNLIRVFTVLFTDS